MRDGPGDFGGRETKLLSTKEELKETLLNIVNKSDKTLKIISPFINFYGIPEWDNMINALKNKKNICEIYTNPENKTKEGTKEENIIDYILRKKIVNENNIIPVNNLHAKIYINDDTALLSSMNLTHSSFNKSIEFGIVTENPEERNEVIEYCKKYIFIYDRKTILDYFSKENINAENVVFEKDRNSIAEFYEPAFYLKLKKDGGKFIQCYADKNDTYQDNIYFYFNIFKNSKEKKIEINTGGLIWSKSKKCYYTILPKNKYDEVLLIPVINVFSERILEKLMEIYNSI